MSQERSTLPSPPQSGDLAGEVGWLPFCIGARLCQEARMESVELAQVSDIGLGCPLLLSCSSSEGINTAPKGLATVFPEVNSCQRVCCAVEMKNFYDLVIWQLRMK